MKRFNSPFLILFFTIIMTGCASIVSKSNYPVALNSDPSGAKVTITDLKEEKVIYEGITPCIVTLKSKHGYFSHAKYSVSFELPDYEPQIIDLEADLDGWYFGNIVFGGLIGLLIVDPATGAMWALPDNLNVSLKKTGGISMQYGEKELKVVFLDSIPSRLYSHLIRIK